MLEGKKHVTSGARKVPGHSRSRSWVQVDSRKFDNQLSARDVQKPPDHFHALVGSEVWRMSEAHGAATLQQVDVVLS